MSHTFQKSSPNFGKEDKGYAAPGSAYNRNPFNQGEMRTDQEEENSNNFGGDLDLKNIGGGQEDENSAAYIAKVRMRKSNAGAQESLKNPRQPAPRLSMAGNSLMMQDSNLNAGMSAVHIPEENQDAYTQFLTPAFHCLKYQQNMNSGAQKKRRLQSKVDSGVMSDGGSQTLVINSIPDEEIQIQLGIDQPFMQGRRKSEKEKEMEANNDYPVDEKSSFSAQIQDKKNGQWGLLDTYGAGAGATGGLFGQTSKANSQTLKVKAPFETLNLKERQDMPQEQSFANANASSTFLRNHQKILYAEDMNDENGSDLKHEPFYRHIVKDQFESKEKIVPNHFRPKHEAFQVPQKYNEDVQESITMAAGTSINPSGIHSNVMLSRVTYSQIQSGVETQQNVTGSMVENTRKTTPPHFLKKQGHNPHGTQVRGKNEVALTSVDDPDKSFTINSGNDPHFVGPGRGSRIAQSQDRRAAMGMRLTDTNQEFKAVPLNAKNNNLHGGINSEEFKINKGFDPQSSNRNGDIPDESSINVKHIDLTFPQDPQAIQGRSDIDYGLESIPKPKKSQGFQQHTRSVDPTVPHFKPAISIQQLEKRNGRKKVKPNSEMIQEEVCRDEDNEDEEGSDFQDQDNEKSMRDGLETFNEDDETQRH
ncbi:hypothetical protein FGO68_gene4101 [Halteria grandinella]|uniref:Uncharacterized protein n=1 Tax=Halteria grandinella TaxID=5974 RepID=A0A8J8P944_HALGN|nr:hypothetical protein FGO68_gene4101 [Halteria grandinella]